MLEIRVNSGEGYVCHQKIATLTPHSQLIKIHSQNETDIIQLGLKADVHLRVKSAITKATLKSRLWCLCPALQELLGSRLYSELP